MIKQIPPVEEKFKVELELTRQQLVDLYHFINCCDTSDFKNFMNKRYPECIMDKHLLPFSGANFTKIWREIKSALFPEYISRF